jgi:hypothetical protein
VEREETATEAGCELFRGHTVLDRPSSKQTIALPWSGWLPLSPPPPLPLSLASPLAQPPRVRWIVTIKQRLDLLLLLRLAQLRWVALLIIIWSQLDEPLGVDHEHVAHVLLGGEDQLVVDDPLWGLVEHGRGGMDEDRLPLHHGLVAVLRVLLGGVREEASGDTFTNFGEVFSGGDDVHSVAVQDSDQLLAHVLSSLHSTSLDEILVTPAREERERQTKRDRERERQRDRERDRERERQRQRERSRERSRGRERDDGELTRMRIQPKGTERITVALMGIRKMK